MIKKELVELLKEMKEEDGEEFIDTVLKLEELVDAFSTDEFLEGKPIITMINELRGAAENSPIAKLKQHNKTQHTHMLVREELLSEEQLENLLNLKTLLIYLQLHW